MSDKQFVDGLYIYPPHEKAPDFVKAAIGINRKKLGNWLREHKEDNIRLDVKESKEGKWYAEVNTYKKEDKTEKPAKDGGFDEKIPF